MNAEVADPLVVGLERLRRRTSAKWRAYDRDVLPVWVAEIDVDLAPCIVEAVTSAIAAGDTGYAAGRDLQRALSSFGARRWGWEPDPDAMRLVPDVMIGIEEVLRLITSRGASVIVTPPVYPPFFDFVAKADRRAVEVPLRVDGRLDLDALEAAFATIAGTGGAFLLCNPHNPHGTVHTDVELARVAQLAGQFDVRVISDEIHAPLILSDVAFVPYLSVAGSERGIAMLSASKAWNLAGLKVALAVPGPSAVDDLAAMPGVVAHGASHVGVIAHTAALNEGEPWLDALLTGLRTSREVLIRSLGERLPAIGYRPGDGTYLAWLDLRPLGLQGDPTDVFLREGRVALRTGADFGTGGAGHGRFNFGTSAAIVGEAVVRMAAAVAAG